jgi:hypothetical protein
MTAGEWADRLAGTRRPADLGERSLEAAWWAAIDTLRALGES